MPNSLLDKMNCCCFILVVSCPVAVIFNFALLVLVKYKLLLVGSWKIE